MPSPSIIVLDLETRESFRDVGGWRPEKLTVSLVGVYDTATGAERVFRVEELPALERLLRAAPRVVGYNLFGFDYAVLKPILSFDPYALPTIDLFDHLQRQLGFRPKLDDVAYATLGRRKSGDGLQAIRLYQEGNWDALARYCLDDVRITTDIYAYGLAHGHVKFPMRDGRIAEIRATWQPVSAIRLGAAEPRRKASAGGSIPEQAQMF